MAVYNLATFIEFLNNIPKIEPKIIVKLFFFCQEYRTKEKQSKNA